MDCLLTWIHGQLELKNKTDNETNGIIRERERVRGKRTRGQRMEADDEVFTVDVTLVCKQPVRSQEGRHYYEHRHSVTSSKMKQMWDERDSWPLKGQFTPKHSGL